ncbi:TonB-dependent receptor [Sphingomonas sp. RB3P16]|uniref:TonB-dependent receptor n=1 Tax=Parasphingomonas frigoris TaxID=3096163 RepID=UPI002FC89ECC
MAAAALVPAPAAAQENRLRFDIPSQDMAAALRSFAKTARSQVAFDGMTVEGRRSQPLAATLTPDAALKRLLRGSDLVYRRGVSGLFIVSRIPARQPRRIPVRRPYKAPLTDDVLPADIVVTARKREERAIDIPIAVSAMSGSTFERLGMRSTEEALGATPGVGVYATGNGLQIVSIRGISTSLGGNANGYYLDDAPFTGVTVPLVPDVRAWDLDRVEVLRGPQGTLFGEGSLGGTVRIITAAPDLGHWQAKADAYASDTEDGGTNLGIKGAINLPLIRDVLAVRVAGTHEVLPGWVDNDSAGRRNLNTERYDTLRTRVTLKPFDGLTLGGSYWYYRAANPINGSAATDDGQFSRSSAVGTRLTYRQYAGNVRYAAAGMEAFYGYSHTAFAFPISGLFVDEPIQGVIAISIDTHEARLTSTRAGPVQWTIGAYSRDARRHDVLEAPFFGVANVSRTTSSARAVFGEVSYTLPAIPVDLSAGLRLYTERLAARQTDDAVAVSRLGGRYDSWNPRVAVSWHPTADSTLYTSVAKGFRAGQLQPSYSIELAAAAGVSLPPALKQDAIWTYEIGGKAELLDRRLFVDFALYHSDWKNVAVRQPIGTSGFNGLINSSGTRTDGAEMALTFRPDPALSITSSATFVRARYNAAVPGTLITRGQPVDDVPKFSCSLAASYRHPVAYRRTAFATTGWRHNSPRTSRSFALFQSGDVIDLVDTRVGLDFGTGSIAVFADNLTNEGGALSYRTVQPLADGTNDITAPRPRPRTIGLEISFKLGGDGS